MGVVCAQGRRPSRLKALLQVTVWVLHSRLRVELRDVTKRQPLAGEGGGEGKIRYADIPGLCRAATLKDIEAQGWSLNPGRYVGVAAGEAVSDEDFKAQLEALNEELETLNVQARALEQTIAGNVAEILET